MGTAARFRLRCVANSSTNNVLPLTLMWHRAVRASFGAFRCGCAAVDDGAGGMTYVYASTCVYVCGGDEARKFRIAQCVD